MDFFLGMQAPGLYRCTQCGESFDNQNQFNHHFFHPPHKADEPYTCSTCPAGYPRFKTEEAYRSHIMIKHIKIQVENYVE
jgi:DNA-directed RNA polymerase subunit RPC12/RpoP